MRNNPRFWIPLHLFRQHRAYRPETRQQMIDSTNRFLSLALGGKQALPRIPRRRVDQGGFTTLLRFPGARSMVEHWWRRILESNIKD